MRLACEGVLGYDGSRVEQLQYDYDRSIVCVALSEATTAAHSVVGLNATIVAEEEVAYLSSRERSSRVARRAEEGRRELHLDVLRVLCLISVESLIDDVVCSPQVRHHVVRMANSSFVHREELRRHVHEVILAVFTTEERFHPSLDCLEWSKRIDCIVLDCVDVRVNGERVERRPQATCVATELWRRALAVLP